MKDYSMKIKNLDEMISSTELKIEKLKGQLEVYKASKEIALKKLARQQSSNTEENA